MKVLGALGGHEGATDRCVCTIDGSVAPGGNSRRVGEDQCTSASPQEAVLKGIMHFFFLLIRESIFFYIKIKWCNDV